MRELLESRSRWFDIGVCLAGVLMFAGAVWNALQDGIPGSALTLLAVPLMVIIAKFPMVLDSGDGAIEVGFDSSILMFLLLTLDPDVAVVLWSLGVIITQLTASKRFPVKVFNVGVGIVGSGVAAEVLILVRGDQRGTPLELLAVACAAVTYFFVDLGVSAVSVAIESSATLRGQLMQRGTLVAILCFVPFDSLGYLGAVVYRSAPPWTLVLLAVPLATLLVATRAVNRGSEHARRLGVLFDAAVRAQTLSDSTQVVSALTEDARRLLRIARVEVRETAPGPHEVGAQIHDGQTDSWIVAPGRHRARSTMSADKQALDAMAAVSSDAFSRLRLTEDMVHLARFDLLTDLPNRGLLLDRVRHGLQTARRRESAIALLFVDLDGFKPVNDRFGHAAGDSVLIDVAHRLSECVRQGDTVARLGGDEFALLFEDVNPQDVASACERILATLSQGVVVAGHDLQLGASIGVAYGDGLDTAEGMLRNADLAMYEAKARGKSRYVVYEPAIGRSRLQRLELVESLRAAVAADQIQVVYQPIVETVTGLISGVEVLARWRSKGVDVRPDVFIRVAEESGLIIPLGDAVLARAARDCAVLQQAAGRPITISVNISAKQLCEPDFVDKVERAVATMGEGVLIIEITERDGIGTDPETLSAMQILSERGVPLAIDDFGVGFSSISYLQDMPIQIIKADASLSANIDRDERACALLKSITMMGDALGLIVVVEGIERAEQLDRLRDAVGAPYAQGYLMHRPMSLPNLLDAVRENRVPNAAADGQDVPPLSRPVSTLA